MLMRTLFSLIVLLLAACGLAEDEQSEKNKYIYITFSDGAFEAYLLGTYDLNGDGRISRYEAQRVVEIDCRDDGIASLWEIGEFSNLQRLNCSGNAITQLDMSPCRKLTQLDCRGNGMGSLEVRNILGLQVLNCSDNLLTQLDLASNPALSRLDCRSNRLVTLDVSRCSYNMDQLDARNNPSLTTIYIASGQSVAYQVDGQTSVVVR